MAWNESLRRLTGAHRDPAEEMERELEALERKADGEVAGYEAVLFNQAGDLCARTGQATRAIGYYGRAIDAYLRVDRFEAAGAVCQKLLRTSPGAVRARCTLAWVAIARGFGTEATRLVDEYVAAAYRAGKDELAREHLERMARISSDDALLGRLGDALLTLGSCHAADRTFARRAKLARAALLPTPEEERQQAAVHAALLGPKELAFQEAAA